MFSQTDLRWSKLKLGNSSQTIGGQGCTTTAICNLINNKDFTPAVAAKKFKYTVSSKPLSDGLLGWDSDFSPLKFVNRVRSFNKSDEYHLRQWINAGGKAILNVKNRYIPFHWVSVDRISAIGFITGIDPLGAKPMWNVKAYYEIVGYSTFNLK